PGHGRHDGQEGRGLGNHARPGHPLLMRPLVVPWADLGLCRPADRPCPRPARWAPQASARFSQRQRIAHEATPAPPAATRVHREGRGGGRPRGPRLAARGRVTSAILVTGLVIGIATILTGLVTGIVSGLRTVVMGIVTGIVSGP